MAHEKRREIPEDELTGFKYFKKVSHLLERLHDAGCQRDHDHILGPGKLLRHLIEADRLANLILFGSPGTGKTSLAEVVARVPSPNGYGNAKWTTGEF